MENKKATVILLAAGNSSRFPGSLNKNYLLLKNKPILKYSLDIFCNHENVSEIIIVVKKEEKDLCQKAISGVTTPKSIKIIEGGNSRKESVFCGLKNSLEDIVIIHDVARPFLLKEMIDNLLDSMNEFKASTIAVKAKDTIKITDNNGVVEYTTKRSNTWQIQTPQCFNKKMIYKAHINCDKPETEITDDCMLAELVGEKVKIIEGSYKNIKITTEEDYKLAELFLLPING